MGAGMLPTRERIALPRFGEDVAPCFGASVTIAIFRAVDGEIVDQVDFTLHSQRALDRIRLLRDQEVDTLICGGLQERVEEMISAAGIRVFSWVAGNVEELLAAHLQGKLRSGADRPPGEAQAEPLPSSPARQGDRKR
jgi:predicted Fe-Mo cluster-binding NifX family protein